jgi:DNA-binding NtrC family response regulator
LRRHRWDGNVRELRSAVQRAYFMSEGPWITIAPDAGPVHRRDDSRICYELGMTWLELERRSLRMALEHCHGDKTAAAKLLGISVRTVHNRLAQMRQSKPSGNAS